MAFTEVKQALASSFFPRNPIKAGQDLKSFLCRPDENIQIKNSGFVRIGEQ
jgi:hypothetical protein